MAGQQVGAARAPDLDVLVGLPFLAGEAYRCEPLPGGLTNRNYKVITASSRQFVARFSSQRSSLLGIDRDAEYRNSRTAADIGVGPAVVAYLPDAHLLVVEWISGRTFQDADLDDEGALERVAAACRTLHAGPRFAGDFDMFRVRERYLRIVQDGGFRLPGGYLDYEPHVRRIEDVLRASSTGTVPCHNDLLAGNIMDDGSQVRFIDYEYAGNNDPSFELGNIWSEAGLDADRLHQLSRCYYGVDSPALVARARLFGLLAKYGWTLWACIQNAISDVDFDFWTWGMTKYDQAVAEFRSAEPDRLISTISESSNSEGAPSWPK